MNSHFPIDGKFSFKDLHKYLHEGFFFWKEDDEHDQKITITIEVDDE